MLKRIYFDKWDQKSWPKPEALAPYFLAPSGHEWFYDQGNDTAGIAIDGVDGTAHLSPCRGKKGDPAPWRVDVSLQMWGNAEHGVLLIYQKGISLFDLTNTFTSKGDMSRLGELVESLHDTPLPVGLFIPFPKAWLAVKEFMETDGQLPKSIGWVRNTDLPPNTFPDP